MRARDVRVHLYDVLAATDAVTSFVQHRTLAEYRESLMLRSAVERQLEIIGEATARALSVEPELEYEIPDARRVVDFRNVVAHGYDVLDDSRVWDIAVRRVPALRDATARALEART